MMPRPNHRIHTKYLYVLPLAIATATVTAFARPNSSMNDLATLERTVYAPAHQPQAEQTPEKKKGKQPYDYADVQPQFPGGEKAMLEYIHNNLKLPQGAEEYQGKVYIRFVISKKGKVKDVEVLRSLHKAYDEEAMRVIKSMPDWKPGMVDGKPVDVYFITPITFRPDISANSTPAPANRPTRPMKDDKGVYLSPEQLAEYPGGEKAMLEYIHSNLKYPEAALKARTEGKVYVRFIINAEGKVVEPQVMRSLSPETDAEAVRVITSLPTWEPATQDGKPVAMYYTIPITFRLAPRTPNANPPATTGQLLQKLVIIDGEEATEEGIKKLSPNDLKSISILDKEKAEKKYGEKGKNGAYIITTKKGDARH